MKKIDSYKNILPVISFFYKIAWKHGRPYFFYSIVNINIRRVFNNSHIFLTAFIYYSRLTLKQTGLKLNDFAVYTESPH